MSRRKLRPDEMELWREVARSAEPLHMERRTKPVPDAQAKPGKPARPQREPVSPFTIGEAAHDAPRRQQTAPPDTAGRLRNAPVSMDAKAFARLKRGKLKPEARLDLHGLTLDAAHGRLNEFILTAQSRGCRLVLVITGKGDREDPYAPMPQRRGVIKRQVPIWLSHPPLGSAVLQTVPAHIRHGGDGAFYVYLRRRR